MNAFELLAIFNRRARKAGWGKEQRERVIKEAQSKDYEHLKEVITAALLEIEE